MALASSSAWRRCDVILARPEPHERLGIASPVIRVFQSTLAGVSLSPPTWRRSGSLPSAPLARCIVTCRLAGDDVHSVVGVDEGDQAHQRAELLIVVVLGRVLPGFGGDAIGIRDAGTLLGELQGGLLGLGKDRGLPPGADQVKPHRAFPAMLGVLGDRKSTRLNSSHLGISYAV